MDRAGLSPSGAAGPIQRTSIEGELRATGPGRSGRRTDQPKLRSEESARAVRRNYDFRAFAFDDLRIHHATPSRSTGIIHRIFTISPPFFPRPVTYPLAASAFMSWMAAGPRIVTSKAGKIRKTRGNASLMLALRASC